MTFAAVAAGALLLVGVALGAAAKPKDSLKATLNVGQEVPKPTGAKPGAGGLFTATLTKAADGSGTLAWKLTFRKLTGEATAAHIHLGKPGKAGPVAITLCGPCTSGVTGTSPATAPQVAALLKNGAYVNVHTAANAGGEIRGKITKGRS